MKDLINRVQQQLDENHYVEHDDIQTFIDGLKEIRNICESTPELNAHSFTKRQAINCDRALTDILLILEDE